MVAYKEMAGACRSAGFFGKVRGVLSKSLEARLPEDAHELANRRYEKREGRREGGRMDDWCF